MTLWLIRAGEQGQHERVALQASCVFLEWHQLPDLARIKDPVAVDGLLRDAFPKDTPDERRKKCYQVWAFLSRIQPTDTVLMPRASGDAVAVGRVNGAYDYSAPGRAGRRHGRKVEWLSTRLPSFALDSMTRYMTTVRMSVAKVGEDGDEERIMTAVASYQSPEDFGRNLARTFPDGIPPRGDVQGIIEARYPLFSEAEEALAAFDDAQRPLL